MTEAQALTALKVTSSVNAFPRMGTTTKDAAGQPSRSVVCARSAADPAFVLTCSMMAWPARGACFCSHALTITNDRRPTAYALGRVVGRGSRKSVYALESAGISVDTGGSAVVRVDAF